MSDPKSLGARINETLGARIKENLKEELRDPLGAARKKAEKAGSLAKFEAVQAFFARFQAHIEKSVSDGDFPPPVRLTREEGDAFNILSWSRDSPAPRNGDLSAVPWQQFSRWAAKEELVLEWKFGHDGGGMESWWDLAIVRSR